MNGYIDRALNISRERFAEKMDCKFFEAMYTQYYKNIYNYISFRINNHFDSEDLACSVFENAISKFHTYNPEIASVEAWLIGIAKNIVTDYLRKRKRKHLIPLDDIIGLVSPLRQPEDIAVKNEDNKALITAMAKLKEKERQVLSMKFATDLKNTEIAKLLGTSDSNIGVILYRSIKKLKGLLEKEGGMYGKRL